MSNYAFIDSQNLHLSIKRLGWSINYKRFRRYLKEKYEVEKAFLFIGFIQQNQDVYTMLQDADFILIFKQVLYHKDARGNMTAKGNCDAELVLNTMVEKDNYNQAVIVAGDGDYYCLAKHLAECDKLKKVLIPDRDNYSILLKKLDSKYIAFVSDLRNKIEYKKENPLSTNLKGRS